MGCGITGASLIYGLRRSGLRVVAFERSARPGTPVKCAGGFSKRSFEITSIPMKKKWIVDRLSGLSFVTPSLHRYGKKTGQQGYIVRKDLLIEHLVKVAESKGITVFRNEGIRAVRRAKDGFMELVSKKRKLKCEILLDCSGVTSPVRRYLGKPLIPTLGAIRFDLVDPHEFDDTDLEQFGVYRCDESEKRATFLLDTKFFPRGYGWIFPFGRSIQMGAVCQGNPSASLKRYMEFHGVKLPSAMLSTGGRIPCKGPEKKIIFSNTVLLGEAGSLVNPFNFAGNYPGMLSASLVANAMKDYFNTKSQAHRENILNNCGKKILSMSSLSPNIVRGADAFYSIGNGTLDILGRSACGNGKDGISFLGVALRIGITPRAYRDIARLLIVNRATRKLWQGGY